MQTRYRFGPFEFDPDSGELASSTGVVVLQPQPALLLEVLLSRAGQMVSRDELYEALWPDTRVEFDLGLNAAIRSLRKTLEDDAGEPRYIETLRGRGYRWIAPLLPLESAVAPGLVLESRWWRRSPAFGLSAVVAALLVVWSVARPEDPHVRAPDPQIVQLRYLLDHGDEADLARALEDLATFAPRTRESGGGLALEAELHYALGKTEEAERAAQAAIANQEDQVDARRVLGLLYLYRDQDPAAALAVMGPVVGDGSESSELLHAYGVALAAQGRFREAMSSMRRALELDPVSPNLTFDGWLVAYLARDFGTSRAWCDDLGRLTGDDNSRCHLLATLASGQRVEAAQIAAEFLRDREVPTLASEASTDAVLDAYWRWDLERPRDHLSQAQRAFGEARALAQLGQVEEALERLFVAASGPAPAMVFARHFPYFDPLVGDPRFTEATGRLKPERSDQE